MQNFKQWASKLISDPKILGGEIVFPNSRLSVRHVGLLAIKGLKEELLEDYPYLTEEDIEFAKLFVGNLI